MKILFVSPYVPTSIRTRPYHFLGALVEHGHALTLLTCWENDRERQALEEWEQRGVRVVAGRLTRLRIALNALDSLVSGLPIQASYSWLPALAAALRAELKPGAAYDVVHVEHLRGSRYALLAHELSRQTGARPRVVWDSVDCISLLFEQARRSSASQSGRFMARVELPRTKRFEARLARTFDRVLVSSAADRRALDNLAHGDTLNRQEGYNAEQRLVVLPNGVDLQYFAPADLPRSPGTIVFSGKMSYHANVSAAQFLVNSIMPVVWASHPDTQVVLVGQNPSRLVRTLTGRQPALVKVTGTVNDIRPYLAQATLAVAPMVYAAGIQNKILEAMAMQTPVVATETAAAALGPEASGSLLIGTDAHSLAAQICALLETAELRERLGKQGRHFVETHHRWDQITQTLEEIYTESDRT